MPETFWIPGLMKKEADMQIKHIGFRVSGLYTVASLALKEQHMSTPTAPFRRGVCGLPGRLAVG